MDDISGKLNELFSSPEGMEKIKSVMNMLAGSGLTDPEPEQEARQEPAHSDQAGELPFDPKMLMKMQSAMQLMNKGDPRVDLLLALKPNMSEEKRKKIDEAIHLLRLVNLMPLLKDQGIL